MTRVLITGGAGYIGSHTAKALSQAGFEPIVLDNLSTGRAESVQWGPLIAGNIGDTDLVRRVIREYRPTGVIHFAASAYVGESVSDPRKYFQNNVVNTLSLLNSMADEGIDRIVFSSTCATYGSPENLPLREDHPQHPESPYGESKLLVERALQAYGSAYGLHWVALRYFNAAGADPDGDLGEVHDPETHLIPLAIQAALGEIPALGIFGIDYPTPDGTAIRDYVHVSDLADAHVRALRHLLDGGDSVAVNLGTGRGHSVSEVAAAVGRIAGAPIPVQVQPRRPGDPPALVADSSKAESLLGWKPQFTDLDSIVSSAWRWQQRLAASSASGTSREPLLVKAGP